MRIQMNVRNDGNRTWHRSRLPGASRLLNAKPWFTGVLAILFGLISPASALSDQADALRTALSAADRHLAGKGSGLVDLYESCPADDQTEWGHEFILAIDIKPIDGSKDAVLIDTGQCSGGNAHGQYLVIATSSRARLILTDLIGDMQFIVEKYYIEEQTIRLEGWRWLENDPHCCPSEKQTLTYDIPTGVARF